MSEQKKKKYNEKEFLSVIPEAMPAQDDQQSIPLRETVFLTLRKLILTGENLIPEKGLPKSVWEKSSEPAGRPSAKPSASWRLKDLSPLRPEAAPESPRSRKVICRMSWK